MDDTRGSFESRSTINMR